MKIQGDLQGLQQVIGPTEVSVTEKTPPVDSPVDASGANDQAYLSGAAQLLSRAAALPDVRMEKVVSVQAALASGNYKVSASEVASKVIDHMRG